MTACKSDCGSVLWLIFVVVFCLLYVCLGLLFQHFSCFRVRLFGCLKRPLVSEETVLVHRSASVEKRNTRLGLSTRLKWQIDHRKEIRKLTFRTLPCEHLRDVEKNDKEGSETSRSTLQPSQPFSQHMVISGLSFHQGNTENRKNITGAQARCHLRSRRFILH